MKPTTSYTETQRYASSQTPVWLFRLTLGSDTVLAASRAITVGAENYSPILAEVPSFEMRSERRFGPGGIIGTEAEITLNDLASVTGSIRDRLSQSRSIGAEGELMLLWVDAAGSWTPADVVTVAHGTVVDWTVRPGRIEIRLRDFVTTVWNRRIGRLLLPSMIGGAESPLLGEPMPIVIGRYDELRLLELLPGVSTRLRQALAVDAPAIQVTSIQGFPVVGIVQVGAELIQYTSVDVTEQTLGTPTDPVKRGQTLALHSTGEPVRSVPPGGFEWLVADHLCVSVADVTGDGVTLPAGDWTATNRSLGSETVQIVKMPLWPVTLRFSRTPSRRDVKRILGLDSFAIPASNTAFNAKLAIDDLKTSTSARLVAGNSLLVIELRTVLGAAGDLLGRFAGLHIVMRYSATRRWNPASQLRLRFVKGATLAELSVPRPIFDETGGSVAGAPGEEAEPVAIPLGVREVELDVGIALSDGDWNVFGDAPAAEMQVEFIPDTGDDTEIFVNSLNAEVSFYGQITASAVRDVRAKVEGWPDALGAVIENPADVAQLLLTHERFAARAPGEIDTPSLDALRTTLLAEGFTYARRISGGERLGDLLDGAGRECACWIRVGGAQIVFARAAVSPDVAQAVELLDDARALVPMAEAEHAQAEDAISTDCLVLTRPEPAAVDAQDVWRRCEDGDEGDGAIPTVFKLRWLDGRSEQALTALGERIWAAVREPFIRYRQEFVPGAAMLEPGDAITADRIQIGLVDAPGWIESVRMESGSRVAVVSRVVEAGMFCWQSGTSFIRVFGFGSRSTAYLSGVPVMSIERGGFLRLIGRLREDAGFAAGPFAQAVTASGGFIYFATGSGGVFTPFMRIGASGDVDLNGTLRESSTYGFLLDDSCLTAQAGLFRLSPRAQEAAFEFDTGGGVLHLAGTLSERCEL